MALSNIKLIIAFIVVSGVVAFVLIALPLPETERTEATLDLTGIWNVNLEDKLAVKIDNCTAKITQTGSALSTRLLCPIISSGINSATLVKGTGAFTGSGGTSIFSGTTDGSTASGIFSNPVINGTFTMTKKVAGPIITVDSTVDAVDAVPGNGICASAATPTPTATPPPTPTPTATPAPAPAAGVCTLRAAIQEANALGASFTEINVPAGTYTLSISGNSEDSAATGDLDITTDLIIVGAGANTTIVQQTTSDRIFDILAGNNVFMEGFTIAEGALLGAQAGGGIQNLGRLALDQSTVRDNFAEGGGGIFQSSASAVIVGSTINSNGAGIGGPGGGIYNSSSRLTIIDSTISGNAAVGSGGGIGQDGASSVANIESVTITGNIADADELGGGSGGGVYKTAGTSAVRNTIIAGNASLDLGDDSDNCSGTWTSTGYNLIGHDSGCTFTATTGDQVGTFPLALIDPLLGPLTDNGGPTKTHAVGGSSPAIDAGDPTTPGSVLSCEVVDQRGVGRPIDGDLDTNAFCDIGAYEAPAALACSTSQCLDLDMNANFYVSATPILLSNKLCNASGVMRVALDAVGNTNGTPTKEDQAFTIDFLSGWLDCPGPMDKVSTAPSTGYLEELNDTTAGLDFPAFVTLDLCLKIDTVTPLGLVQNCGPGFADAPLDVECIADSYVDFTCDIIITGTPIPGFRNPLGTPVASVDGSATIVMTAVGKLAYPGDSDGDGCPDARENQAKSEVLTGGGRDPLDPWDWYDVNKDGVIDLINDILGVIDHWQPNIGGAAPYDIAFDRGPSAGPHAWDMTAPDGVIDLINDIIGVIDQFSPTGCT